MKLAIVLLLVAGCVVDPIDVESRDPAEPGEVDNTPAPEVSLAAPGESDQGRFLLGDGADLLAGGKPASHISVKATTRLVTPQPGITKVIAANGALTAYANTVAQFSGDSGRFKDMVFATSSGFGTLRISDVTSEVGVLGSTRYVLKHKLTASSLETNYCKAGGAKVVSGYWTVAGLHQPDATTITFSCDEAVITKCMNWGYPPPDAETLGGPGDLWTVHQACTRMARADYCSNGKHHTMDETTILIRDLYRPGGQPDLDTFTPTLHVAPGDPAPPDQYWFEAVWRGGSLPVKCLSKERWKSLPIGGYCPAAVPDPRDTVGAMYCEDASDNMAAGIIFNASKVGQLYLNRWTNGTDELVTVRGVPGTTRKKTPPFPGYQFVEQIGLLMRNPPHSLDLPGSTKPDLAQIDLMSLTTSAVPLPATDRVASLTGGSATSAYTTLANGFEGYVYTRNDLGTYIELNLYRRTGGTDLVTASVKPAGFEFVQLLGYIDPWPPN
ncbi:MAG: ADYC domain-containing protein [Kofleriaceae bacterium]